MSTDYKKQPAAYHGIRLLKYAVRESADTKGTVTVMPYAKSISFEPQVESEQIYANDRSILAAVADQGYTGEIGTTATDPKFEEALGHTMTISGGTADLKINGYKRVDIYYEFSNKTEDGIDYVVKVWALNAEVSKATKTHETDENTPKIGEYQYPITVYGDKLKTSEGEDYRDENGNEKYVTRIMSYPDDEGYDTFGDTVPTPEIESSDI